MVLRFPFRGTRYVCFFLSPMRSYVSLIERWKVWVVTLWRGWIWNLEDFIFTAVYFFRMLVMDGIHYYQEIFIFLNIVHRLLSNHFYRIFRYKLKCNTIYIYRFADNLNKYSEKPIQHSKDIKRKLLLSLFIRLRKFYIANKLEKWNETIDTYRSQSFQKLRSTPLEGN